MVGVYQQCLGEGERERDDLGVGRAKQEVNKLAKRKKEGEKEE